MLLCHRDLNVYVSPTAHMTLLPLDHKRQAEVHSDNKQQVQCTKKLPKIDSYSTEPGANIFTTVN